MSAQHALRMSAILSSWGCCCFGNYVRFSHHPFRKSWGCWSVVGHSVIVGFSRRRRRSICTQRTQVMHSSVSQEALALEPRFLLYLVSSDLCCFRSIDSTVCISFSQQILRELPKSSVATFSLKAEFLCSIPLCRFFVWNAKVSLLRSRFLGYHAKKKTAAKETRQR